MRLSNGSFQNSQTAERVERIEGSFGKRDEGRKGKGVGKSECPVGRFKGKSCAQEMGGMIRGGFRPWRGNGENRQLKGS